jgi:hypothetical protein
MKNVYVIKYVNGFVTVNLTVFESKKEAEAYIALLGTPKSGCYELGKISFQKKTKTLKKP